MAAAIRATVPGRLSAAWLASACLVLAAGCADSKDSGGPSEPAIRPESRLDVEVAIGPLEQMVPAMAAAEDGALWVSSYWEVETPGGLPRYQMRLQRLDPAGSAQLGTLGVLVSDEPSLPWVTPYGLGAASDGSAIVVFADVRNVDHVDPATENNFDLTAYRVSPTGEHLWGEAGVPVATSLRPDASAKLVVQDGDETVVAWERWGDDALTVPGVVMLQRLAADGRLLWGEGLEIAAPPPGAAVRPQLAATAGDQFVLVWLETPTPDTADNDRVLFAMKYDALGRPAWNERVVVSDPALEIPYASDPLVTSDGDGGVFIAWTVFVGNQAEIRVQHLSSSGTPTMPPGGVLPADRPFGVDQVLPQLAALPGGDAVVGFSLAKEENLVLYTGLTLQRLSRAGERVWGDDGSVLVPLVVDEVWKLDALRAKGDEVFAFHDLSIESNAFTSLLLARVPAAGGAGAEPTPLSGSDDRKFHVHVSPEVNGGFWTAWQDQRTDPGDIYGTFYQAEPR